MPSPGLTLNPRIVTPRFSPDIRDYAVRCRARVNLTTLRLRARTNGVISVDGATGHVLDLPLALVENQALVVQAPDPVLPSGPPVEYWFRCLPRDFPELRVAADSGTAPPGWYLTANVSTSAGSAYHAMVLNEHGTPVWYRPERAINTKLLPGNIIAWAPDLGPGFGADPNGAYTLFHLGTMKTSFFPAPIQPTDQHELVQLGNGHRLLLGTPLRTGLDLSVLGSRFATTHAIVDCVVEETDASGALVWEWRMSEHVDIAESKTTPRLHTTPVNVNGTSAADVYHCNSVEVGPSGNVLISSRHTSAVYLVDKTTGGIIWKLGGTPSNHDHAQILTIQSDPGGTISGQHDARFRPNGNVTLYDDHTGMTGPARGLEYAIDTTAGTATLVWQYAAPDGLPAGATGSFRRSADGNDNIVGWGFKPGQAFTEVDAAGNVLLDVTFPNGELTYRNVKEPAAAIDAGLLRRSNPSPSPVTGWQHLGGAAQLRARGDISRPRAARRVRPGYGQPAVLEVVQQWFVGWVAGVGWGAQLGAGCRVAGGRAARRVRPGYGQPAVLEVVQQWFVGWVAGVGWGAQLGAGCRVAGGRAARRVRPGYGQPAVLEVVQQWFVGWVAGVGWGAQLGAGCRVAGSRAARRVRPGYGQPAVHEVAAGGSWRAGGRSAVCSPPRLLSCRERAACSTSSCKAPMPRPTGSPTTTGAGPAGSGSASPRTETWRLPPGAAVASTCSRAISMAASADAA